MQEILELLDRTHSPFMKATELYSLRLKAQEIEDKHNAWLREEQNAPSRN
jgi:hypothetical protein